jgi:hypothetical protein
MTTVIRPGKFEPESRPEESTKAVLMKSRGIYRIPRLKLWFLLLMLVGLVAVTLTVAFFGLKSFRAHGFSPGRGILIERAFAESSGDGHVAAGNPSGPRVFVMWGVFAVLGLVYLGGIFRVLFSTNLTNIDTAADLVKTLTGFFVGTATNVLGLG